MFSPKHSKQYATVLIKNTVCVHQISCNTNIKISIFYEKMTNIYCVYVYTHSIILDGLEHDFFYMIGSRITMII